ncbi:MAG: DNA mismatch repair protein MutS [Syntrophomonadaceae bacterium]|nr:DNA mismatch repair protein MutS [Syntrophomonadaceae bacterium]
MKAFLMYRDHDFELDRDFPVNAPALIQDLELKTLFNAMALGDEVLLKVATKAVLSGTTDLDTILYRQNILKDSIRNSAIVRDLYALAVEAIEQRKKTYWGFLGRPSLYSLIEVLQMYVGMLRKMRAVADEHLEQFESEGLTALLAMLQKELSDEYFALIQKHLAELKFRQGVLISAELGEGNKGVNYTLHKSIRKKQSWLERIFAAKPPVYAYYVHERDEAGSRALAELKNRGINQVINALAQSTDHIYSFFAMLRTELAFYIGCLNLYQGLAQKGEAVTFPLPAGHNENRLSCSGLYDVSLAINLEHRIVGNDVNADTKSLIIITGANQGGKSTFLRSIGLAQLMMQCGMFVPAGRYCASVCSGLFSHFKREEDADMNSGKLDEELSRMSHIVDNLSPYAMVLFNESFAATNEREGSEIAGQIVGALLEKRIKVCFVTHLYKFAHGRYEQKLENALYLRAEREINGQRTFKMVQGEPLQTSYGADLYNQIFNTDVNPTSE